MVVSEYDAFGPWIYEVNEKHPLPRLFVGHVEAHDYDILFKIPRDIDRRMANPDMPLYNLVIGCFEDKIYIYTRDDVDIRKQIVRITDICALKDIKNLLLGEYQIFTNYSVVIFKYNTVSNDIIEKFTDWIRSKYKGRAPQDEAPHISHHAVATIDIIYSNLYRKMRQNDDSLKIIGLQPKERLKYNKKSLFQRIYNTIMTSHIQSSLYLKNQIDVILLQRDNSFTRRGASDYSSAYTYIPYKHIDQVATNPSTLTDEVEQVVIKAGTHFFDAMFTVRNASMKGFVEYMQRLSRSTF